jgi:hypothetical protein
MAHHDAQRPISSASELVPLSRMQSFRMAEGEPDVRGWPVVGADGSAVGRVAELLVDPAASEIAAVLVALPESDPTRANRAVLPMEHVRIDDRGQRLVADATALSHYADPASGAAPAAGAAAAPAGTQVTREREANGDEVIRVPVVEERLVVEKRPVVTEMLVIRKRAVQTERVVEADLQRERVEVDQRDFTRDDQTRPER